MGEILTNCVKSVLETEYPNFEVLFVDNASEDKSIDFVKEAFCQNKKLKIIRNTRNLGYAEGNNVGIIHSKGDYIILLNNDTRVDPSWMTPLINAARPMEVGAVQGKLVRMDNPNLIDCAGGLIDYYGYHFERGRDENAAKYDRASEIFYAKGACILLKRDLIKKTGFFDADFFLYFDEVDLCWRVWLSGCKVIYAPNSQVLHVSGATASVLRQESKLFFYARNHILMLLKNYSLANMLVAISASIVFETRNILLFFGKRKPLFGLSILRGLLWNLAHFRESWFKRQHVQKSVRKVTDEIVRKQMMKPYPPFPLYALLGRKRYSKGG